MVVLVLPPDCFVWKGEAACHVLGHGRTVRGKASTTTFLIITRQDVRRKGHLIDGIIVKMRAVVFQYPGLLAESPMKTVEGGDAR